MSKLLVLAVIAIIATTVYASDPIAHVAIRTGTLKGELFFSQNYTGDNTIAVKVSFTTGYTVGSNYSFFVHAYGDNFAATSHGGCFSTQTSSFGSAQPTTTGGWIAYGTLNTGIIDLVGATTSIIGRTIAVYENLALDTCAAAAAATPVGRGVVGAAWPGLGVVNVNPAGAPLTSNPTSAYAEIVGTTGTYGDNSGISGGVYFQALADGTITVLVEISGATIVGGRHALHVHEYGDLSLSNATSMNGHWNPWKRNHGAPLGDRHAGDMGNVTAVNNYIYSQRTFDLLTFQGIGSIIGRGVVLHTLRDDGNPNNETASVGNAGGRLARGVIGVSNRAVPYPSSSSSSTGVTTSSSSSSSSTGVNGATNTATLSFAAIAIAAMVAIVANKQQ